MLVLSRKRDQDIVIETPDGQKIVVCVVEIVGNKVRLGITGHKEIKVHRGEVHLAIERQKRLDAQGGVE